MRAGPLDRRVTIEAPTPTQNSFGEPVEAWSELATVWARKRDVRASERFTAQQRLAQETAVFEIRFRSDVTPKMRLVEGGKVYTIDGIAEIRRREGLEIAATAVVPG